MRRSPLVRRSLVGLATATAVAVVPLAVLAATGAFNGALDQQTARWTTTPVSTSSTAWRNVPGLKITRCTLDQVTAMLNVKVRGAPVLFRVVIDDVPEAPMLPESARFVPSGTESFSHAFVRNTGPFEANDNHQFRAQWRSPTGNRVTLREGMLNLLFEEGTQACL